MQCIDNLGTEYDTFERLDYDNNDDIGWSKSETQKIERSFPLFQQRSFTRTVGAETKVFGFGDREIGRDQAIGRILLGYYQ